MIVAVLLKSGYKLRKGTTQFKMIVFDHLTFMTIKGHKVKISNPIEGQSDILLVKDKPAQQFPI